jgi:hypothetical protein
MTDQAPSADEVAGIYWWNSMSENERGAVLHLAKANSVAEAWDWHKQALATGDAIDIKTVYATGGGIMQDEKSWTEGYLAGHSGKPADVPSGVDRLAWISGLIEGKADRDAGRVRPLSRKPPSR